MLRTIVLALFSFAPVSATQAPVLHKQSAAGPQDILDGQVRLPDLRTVLTRSRSALVELRAPASDPTRREARVPVPRGARLTVVPIGMGAGGESLEGRFGAGTWAALERAGADGRRESLVPTDAWTQLAPDRWSLRAAGDELSLGLDLEAERAPSSGGLVLVDDGRALELASSLSGPEFVCGRQLALLARLSPTDDMPRIESAEVHLRASAGRRLTRTMWDDGAHADDLAGDGLYGAFLPRDWVGEVSARVHFEGQAASGPFARSTFHTLTLVDELAFLTGRVRIEPIDKHAAAVDLEALVLESGHKLHISAEVWGHDASGAAVPLCWLTRMQTPRLRDGAGWLRLEFDRRWMALAGASGPLSLRNVRVQDPDTHAVLDSIDALELPRDDHTAPRADDLPVASAELWTRPGNELALGIGPTAGGPNLPTGAAAITRALMLVHGYCSGGNVWPLAQFSGNRIVFSDPNQNRTNDQFALLMRQQAGGVRSFGVVGHSQGGLAALHLLTYYTSGLERATGGRPIQSVASPYQGTPLASLGGFACGVNNDMTPAGAATWLAGIPSWARAEVDYYSTSNSGAVCNFLASLVLSDPEDGVVEMVGAQLPGANNMGHVTGWCHTTGMSNPASYTDSTRNAQLDAAAAR